MAYEELKKENAALKNKLAEVMHYNCLMIDFLKDNNTCASLDILHWTMCLTDNEYRKQFGDEYKKRLKELGIKA